MLEQGLLELKGSLHYLTDAGKVVGGEFRKGAGGFYFLWPADIRI